MGYFEFHNFVSILLLCWSFPEGINPYYIAQLADLDTNAYEQAIKLIKENHFTAPSALDVVTSSNYEKALAKYTSGEESMKLELTDEIHASLLAQAQAMFDKYSGYIGDAKTNVALITGETTMALTARPKGVSSVLNKLITKFEKGKLNLTPEVIEAECHACSTRAKEDPNYDRTRNPSALYHPPE